MVPARSGDKKFLKPHIEVTADCFKFLDRGYSDEDLFKRTFSRVNGDEKKRSDKIKALIGLGVSSPNEIVKALQYAFSF